MARELVAIAALALAATGCGRPCTLIGCADALAIDVRLPDGGRAERFGGRITLDGQARTVVCPSTVGPVRCDPPRLIVSSAPATVPLELEVPDAGLSWSGTLAPVYTTSTPNGPGCGPICRQASETITLEVR